MKFLNKKIVFLVLLSVFLGFILGQNYDIAKNYFNFEFLKATVSPTLPSPFEEPELNFSEINFESLLLEEELVPENEKVNEIGRVGQVKETTQLTLAEIQEILDDINEQIDMINQEINKLRGEIPDFSESEEELVIEEEILLEEELEDEEEEKDEEKEEKKEVEGDIGRPSSAGASGGGGGGADVSLAPTPIINLSFPTENPANKDIEVSLSASNLKPASYDVKISIFEISEQSEQKRTISEIYDGEKWQSSYNYLLRVFSGTSFEGNFKLKIKQDKQDFRGEADIIIKIRDNEKEKIQAQWQGKINIIEPELEEEELKKEDLGGEEGEGEQGEEQEEEQEQGEENGEKIFFEISPLSLIFRTPYGEIPEPQLLYVSGLADGVYVSGLIDGLVFPSWIIVEAEQDNFKVSVDVPGKNLGTYEDIIEINYRSQSEKIPVSLEIFEEVKNLLKNEFFEEWEEEKLKYWDSNHNQIKPSGDSLVGNYSLNISHSYKYSSGKNDDQNFFYSQADSQEIIYYGEIWVKGVGDVRIGILRPGYSIYNYGDWESIDTEDWTKITHTIKGEREGEEGSFRIQHRQSEEKGETNLFIGATWISIIEPPENWPQN